MPSSKLSKACRQESARPCTLPGAMECCALVKVKQADTGEEARLCTLAEAKECCCAFIRGQSHQPQNPMASS